MAEPPAAKASPAAPPKAAPAAPSASSAPAPTKAPAPPAPPKGAPPAAAPAAAKPAAKPATRVETSNPSPRPAQKPVFTTPLAPTATPLPHAAGAKPAVAAPGAAKANDAPQQAGRGIAAAKSIDDLSDLDAETLFGDAELDLVSAALASAADWPDDDEVAAPKAPPTRSTAAAPAPARAEPAKLAESSEDPFDLFGLDDNAPLELIDDSTLPPASPRKTASR